MLFTGDTEEALAEATALVNTRLDGVDQLDDQAGLDAFLERVPDVRGAARHRRPSSSRPRDPRAAAGVWSAPDRAEAAALVNAILREPRPRRT